MRPCCHVHGVIQANCSAGVGLFSAAGSLAAVLNQVADKSMQNVVL